MTEPTFILHIGRHKSGTSSLQAYLADHPDRLAAEDILYPRAGRQGIAHHALAGVLQQRSMREDPQRADATLRQFRHDLARELDGRPARRVLLSSEAFQNARAVDVAAAFAPRNSSVIVYLREQADYLVSSYQQVVHARQHAADLATYGSGTGVDYDHFLAGWEAAWPGADLQVGVYARQALLRSNVIDDFFARLGIEVDASDEPQDRNPSIGGALLELKRLLNARLPVDRWPKGVYQAFSQAAGTDPALRLRPALTPQRAEQVRAHCAPSNAKVARRRFDRDVLFQHLPTVSHTRALGFEDFQLALQALLQARREVAQCVVEVLLGASGLDTARRDRVLAQFDAGNTDPYRRVLRRLARQGAGPDWAWNFPVDALAA
ncbi:hypothetical protein KAK06_00045 [Ideonella sp. 4Y11]|uniref:Sulfotransferase family protein n=1 Tax=Ideonella aquatica TaxID=2824119 RepID=A0A940YBV8_9BURK|nr:hypothetical protein [Ideonella aquatica]MBQ0957333.1 hypothetical protein [Ideonella aquatica]